MHIGRNCTKLRVLFQFRACIHKMLVAARSVPCEQRDKVLMAKLELADKRRSRHFKERCQKLVCDIQSHFDEDPVAGGPLKLLLQIVRREKSDARGALVREAAAAGCQGSKR